MTGMCSNIQTHTSTEESWFLNPRKTKACIIINTHKEQACTKQTYI